MLQSLRYQRVRHNLVTEQQHLNKNILMYIHIKIKEQTYNQDYFIQEGSHLDSMKQSKALQTSKG